MKKFLIIIVIIFVLAALAYLVIDFGVPYYQDTFAPETKTVYSWTDENGVVHFSDDPIYVPDPDKVEQMPDVEVKRYEDYGKERFVKQKGEETAESKPAASSSKEVKSKKATSSSAQKKSGDKKEKKSFIDKMRKAKDDSLPEDNRTADEKVIHTVPPAGTLPR